MKGDAASPSEFRGTIAPGLKPVGLHRLFHGLKPPFDSLRSLRAGCGFYPVPLRSTPTLIQVW